MPLTDRQFDLIKNRQFAYLKRSALAFACFLAGMVLSLIAGLIAGSDTVTAVGALVVGFVFVAAFMWLSAIFVGEVRAVRSGQTSPVGIASSTRRRALILSSCVLLLGLPLAVIGAMSHSRVLLIAGIIPVVLQLVTQSLVLPFIHVRRSAADAP
jgi:hypothetical protein